MLYVVDRSAVILKPTLNFVEWLNTSIAKDGSDIELSLEPIQANCRVFLVEQKDSPEEIVSYIDENYLNLFKLEVASWFDDERYWPKMDLQTFWEFFQIEILDEVVDLLDSNLVNNPLLD